MKSLASKLLPLITKLKGKKPVIIILSAVVIGGYIFAVQKGYIEEDITRVHVIIDYIDSAFKAAPIDTVNNSVDSLKIVADSITVQ